MSPLALLAVAGAGLVAGAVNTIAGAGSLLTFPLLVAVGLSPLSANVTNDIGVVPGNLTGAIGFRRELRGLGPLLVRLLPLAVLGALAGAGLLLAFPARAFQLVAPVLLFLASLVTAVQPALARRRDRTKGEGEGKGAFWVVMTAISVYAGYFGTGIGVLFLASLGIYVDEELIRLNAVKQLMALVSNGAAGILFAFVAPVNWSAAAVLAVASGCGGPLGARLARHVRPGVLRLIICVVGAGAAGYLGWQRFG